jgi:hypothetical protein
VTSVLLPGFPVAYTPRTWFGHPRVAESGTDPGSTTSLAGTPARAASAHMEHDVPRRLLTVSPGHHERAPGPFRTASQTVVDRQLCKVLTIEQRLILSKDR